MKINIISNFINDLVVTVPAIYFVEKCKQAFLASFARVSQYFSLV